MNGKLHLGHTFSASKCEVSGLYTVLLISGISSSFRWHKMLSPGQCVVCRGPPVILFLMLLLENEILMKIHNSQCWWCPWERYYV